MMSYQLRTNLWGMYGQRAFVRGTDERQWVYELWANVWSGVGNRVLGSLLGFAVQAWCWESLKDIYSHSYETHDENEK